jgi:probable rRNA maturation factor
MENCELWANEPGYLPWKNSVEKLLDRVMQTNYSEPKSIAVDLHLIDDPYMQELNLKYMGEDAPTNVLSFPLFNPGEIEMVLGSGICIGDIFLSYQKIMSEIHVSGCGTSFFDKCSHLFVHGVLHLLGMDHTTRDEAEAMEHLEICILESFGVKNPYVDIDENKEIGEANRV